jgi:hypothetical protein
MTAAELAAYIGAAAWLPQIATWVYRWFVRPKITITPDRYGEVGFTSFGPIFNLRMAFASDRKDAIIDGFELLVQNVINSNLPDFQEQPVDWNWASVDIQKVRARH